MENPLTTSPTTTEHTPPVDEVVIGLSFKSISEAMPQATVILRDNLKEQYPLLQYQPRLAEPAPFTMSISQTLNPPSPLNFAPSTQDSFSRIWFVSEDDSRIVQLQSDRLVVNWRRRATDYPGFDAVLSRFFVAHQLLCSSLKNEAAIEPTLLEVTYYDWFPQSTMPQAKALNFAKAAVFEVDYAKVVPESQDWTSTFVINRTGHLAMKLFGQVKGNVMRVLPGSSSIEVGSLATWTCWVQLEPQVSDQTLKDEILFCRKLLKSSFQSLTTPEAKAIWGLS